MSGLIASSSPAASFPRLRLYFRSRFFRRSENGPGRVIPASLAEGQR